MGEKKVSIEFEEVGMGSASVSEDISESLLEEIIQQLSDCLDPYTFESEIELNIINDFLKRYGGVTKENWREFCEAVIDYFSDYDAPGILDDQLMSGFIIDDSVEITDNALSFIFYVSARHNEFDIDVGQSFRVRISLKDEPEKDDGR